MERPKRLKQTDFHADQYYMIRRSDVYDALEVDCYFQDLESSLAEKNRDIERYQ